MGKGKGEEEGEEKGKERWKEDSLKNVAPLLQLEGLGERCILEHFCTLETTSGDNLQCRTKFI